MKKRRRFPIFRCLTVMLVGYFFANFFYFIAGALNFWPAYILAFIIIMLCVNGVHSIITEWRGERTNAGAPSSSPSETKSKIIIKQGRDKASGIWACWIDGPPRLVAYNEVPGKALACLLAGLGYPSDYQIVDADPNRPGES